MKNTFVLKKVICYEERFSLSGIATTTLVPIALAAPVFYTLAVTNDYQPFTVSPELIVKNTFDYSKALSLSILFSSFAIVLGMNGLKNTLNNPLSIFKPGAINRAQGISFTQVNLYAITLMPLWDRLTIISNDSLMNNIIKYTGINAKQELLPWISNAGLWLQEQSLFWLHDKPQYLLQGNFSFLSFLIMSNIIFQFAKTPFWDFVVQTCHQVNIPVMRGKYNISKKQLSVSDEKVLSKLFEKSPHTNLLKTVKAFKKLKEYKNLVEADRKYILQQYRAASYRWFLPRWFGNFIKTLNTKNILSSFLWSLKWSAYWMVVGGIIITSVPLYLCGVLNILAALPFDMALIRRNKGIQHKQ